MLEDTIVKCRTARRFIDEKIPLEILKGPLIYASMAPSNANAHPVEFIVVNGKEDMDYLAAMDRFGAKHLVDAPLTVLIVANKDVCKYWAREAAMTTAYLDLLTQEEDCQSGYSPSHDNTTDRNVDAEAYVRNHFNIPDNYDALGVLTIGKKDEKVRIRKEPPTDEKIHENRF